MNAGRIDVGIDIGGTFSDVVAVSEGRRVLAAFKVHSTPTEPATAVLDGLRRLAELIPAVRGGGSVATMYHGTTIATNALIQKRGANTALLTTEGCRDVLALRRQARPDLYRLDQRISVPLVPDRWRLEVGERLAADGTVLRPLDPAAVRRLGRELREAGIESVAICFLHSFENPAHEREAAQALAAEVPDLEVSLSVDLCPELGEFERTSTTVANAYVSPPVRRYLQELRAGAARYGIDEFNVVKSNGGLTSSDNARRHPVHLVESGPAAGLSAVAELGRCLGVRDLIAFDMGGTTAKVGVIQGGAPRLARELYADRFVGGEDSGGYVIKSPVVDLAEIGAGGGSIAWIDPAGVLKVGPHSAGSDPGPACYGLGSDEPTVTDAHLVVGTLGAESEALPSGLDVDRARDALRKRVAEPFGWSIERAAHAVLSLATATMAETVRLMTVRRGIDVRDFTLVAYGGAGPLHAADIAAEVGISTIVVPPYPAMFSAIGAIMCDVRHDLVHSMVRDLDELGEGELATVFGRLAERARELLDAESLRFEESQVQLRRHVDVRHQGQLHQLGIPVGADVTVPEVARRFRDAYRGKYGYVLPDSRLELVNVRMEIVVPRWPAGEFPAGDDVPSAAGAPRTVLDADGRSGEVPVVSRHDVVDRGSVDGPALVVDAGAVTPVRAGQTVRPLGAGALVIERNDR